MDINEEVLLELLQKLGVNRQRAETFAPHFSRSLNSSDITTPLRLAHFLAEVLHESGKLRWVEENLNYSAEGLRKVFKKYFTPSQAQRYARKPRLIGARVYANRMGNDDEGSGDGYRYRGRGFIQLTGKNNYRDFSAWVEEDVVAYPDRVATVYPVDSAIYYWTQHAINALADSDNLKAVTKRINGGYNGLEDRLALLEKAKRLLAIEPRALTLDFPSHEVIATQLNLRSRPRVAANTRLGTLTQGTQVLKIGTAETAGWSRIRVSLNGSLVEGVVASRYLKPLSAQPVPAALLAAAAAVPAAHLKQGRRDISRARDGGRTYPLGEVGMPRRRGQKVAVRVRKLQAIVDFLDTENHQHRRYQPKSGTTYCNIYAHDYCYLAEVYLPRVWWTGRALDAIRAGDSVTARYGESVRELNANALYDWFDDYGRDFGWQRVFNLDELQAAANNGKVCIIVGQRRDLNRAGHISVVVAEQDALHAERNAAGEVTRPVQSQAGRNNVRRGTAPGTWWSRAQFRAFAFWHHA